MQLNEIKQRNIQDNNDRNAIVTDITENTDTATDNQSACKNTTEQMFEHHVGIKLIAEQSNSITEFRDALHRDFEMQKKAGQTDYLEDNYQTNDIGTFTHRLQHEEYDYYFIINEIADRGYVSEASFNLLAGIMLHINSSPLYKTKTMRQVTDFLKNTSVEELEEISRKEITDESESGKFLAKWYSQDYESMQHSYTKLYLLFC